MRATEWLKGSMLAAAMLAACGFTGCKSLTERYIALEVWKYERCFGHLPPGFVPPNAQIAAPGRARRCVPADSPRTAARRNALPPRSLRLAMPAAAVAAAAATTVRAAWAA